jgi:putative ABC transport system permease protein
VRFFEQLEQRLAALPGVRSVGAVSQLPLGGGTSQAPYAYDDETAEHWERVTADARTVTPGLFGALGFRLAAGRPFDERDTAEGTRVVIVDELLAAKAWPGESALGKRVQLPVFGPERITREWHGVVGVVGHARLHDLSRDVREQVYLPQSQSTVRAMDVVVRSANDPGALGALLRREVHAMDGDLPVHALRPMEDYVSAALGQSRFTTLLSSAFAAAALLLVAVGLYAVVSFMVGQRRREFGIRLALGAQGDGILRLVVGQGMRLVGLGLGLGLAGALLTGRALSALLYGVSPADPATLVGALVLVAGVALLASCVPARRAARVDPAAILRDE